MPNYRPIPGQEMMNVGPSGNFPTDDLTMMARAKASNILMPYANMGMSMNPGIPSTPTGSGTNPIPGGPMGSGIEDKLYRAVHPDTFNKILETIMQFVTGKPIPRQGGGPVDPDQDYVVGENGPERFRPDVPGQIIPRETMTPMGPVERPGLTYRGQMSPAESMGLNIPPPYTPEYSAWESGVSGEGKETSSPGVKPYAGPRPWRNRPAVNERYDIPEAGGGWKDYGEGISYKLGPEDTQGDEMARKRIMGLTAPGGAYIPGQGRFEGIPIPERSYYEAHPEERAMDIATESNRELMDMFKRAKTPDARAAIGDLIKANIAAPEGYFKTSMEHGPQSPLSQERLAHAESLRGTPAAHMEAIREQSRAHLEGIQKQVAGHLVAAKIAAETKDPIMKEIGSLITQGQKNAEMYGIPFNPQETISQALGIYRAMGAINDEQWNKLPKEYKPPVQGAKLAPDGNWYIPDPKRKGKYLRVE